MLFDFSSSLEPFLALQRPLPRSSDQSTEALAHWQYPQVSVVKNDTDYVLVAELPGVKKEDLQIEVKGETVRLAGERRIEALGKTSALKHRERGFGRFDRRFELPFVIDATRVKATYEDGLLAVTLPPVEAEKPTKIAVV